MWEPMSTGATSSRPARHPTTLPIVVDLHCEIQAAHPRHDEVPARPILVGEGKAGAASVAGGADVGERPQAVLEPRPVDLQRSPRPLAPQTPQSG